MERLILTIEVDSHHEGTYYDTIPILFSSKKEAETEFAKLIEAHRQICETSRIQEDAYFEKWGVSGLPVEEWPDIPETNPILNFAGREMYIDLADKHTEFSFSFQTVDEWFENYKD